MRHTCHFQATFPLNLISPLIWNYLCQNFQAMKKWILLLTLAIIGVLTWYFFVTKKKPQDEVPKQQPLAVSKHSDSFNVAINKVLSSYYALTNDFVNWDTAAVTNSATELKNYLEQTNFDELTKDTVIHQTAATFVESAKAELQTILQPGDLTTKRHAFNNLSDNMYNLLRTIRYDRSKIYLQECPMAFNDNEPGVWLSRSDSVRNPYLGLHHPKYKSGMLECGGPKDTLNFTGL